MGFISKLTKFQKILAGLVVVSALTAGFFWYVAYRENRGNILTVAFLDVGQGDAIFVEAPNGNQMIIDGGPNASILRELGKVMPFYDRSIDVLVITNPDKDHFAGFIDVLKRYDVGLIIESGTKNDTETYKNFTKAVEERGSKKGLAKRGMSLVLDVGRSGGDNSATPPVSLDIIFPDRDVSEYSTNDGSIIARLIYGETSIMFTGDTTQKIERRLTLLNKTSPTDTPLKSDLIKVAHHGSKTSSLKEFVQAVQPKTAVISLGKNNKYGHPNKETLDTLDSLYISTLRTDKRGTIIFKSDGKTFRDEI